MHVFAEWQFICGEAFELKIRLSRLVQKARRNALYLPKKACWHCFPISPFLLLTLPRLLGVLAKGRFWWLVFTLLLVFVRFDLNESLWREKMLVWA